MSETTSNNTNHPQTYPSMTGTHAIHNEMKSHPRQQWPAANNRLPEAGKLHRKQPTGRARHSSRWKYGGRGDPLTGVAPLTKSG